MAPFEYPEQTGYVYLPPIWVREDFDRVEDPRRTFDVDLATGAEVVVRQDLGSGITGEVCRDGFVAFSYAPGAAFGNDGEVFDVVAQRTTIANAHIACLSAMITLVDGTGISPPRMVHPDTAVHSRDGRFTSVDPVARAMLSCSPGREFGPWGGPQPQIEVMTVRIRMGVSVQAVDQSFILLRHLMGGRLDRLRQYELFLQASVAFDERNFGLALITAFALTESAAIELWRRTGTRLAQEAGAVFGNGSFERMSIDTRLALLRTTGAITEELWGTLNAARKARNNWSHGLHAPSSDDALAALRGTAKLLALVHDLPFSVYPVHGGGAVFF